MTAGQLFTIFARDYLWRTTFDVEAAVSSRCVAGKAILTVTATNPNGIPFDVTLTTTYGTKSFVSVAAGKSAFHGFTTRLGSVPAGTATVTASGQFHGAAVTDTVQVPYSAFSCN